MFPLETRILVIDDVPFIRDLVRGHLNALGYKDLMEAGDGEEGHRLLIHQLAAGTPINMVISDWNMPGLSGLDLLKILRNTPEWKDILFILLTAEAEVEQVTEAVMAGVSQYIVKPFSAISFEEKLKSLWKKCLKTGV